MSFFNAPPAGAPVPPASQVSHYYRKVVYPRNAVSGAINTLSGREAQFSAEVGGRHWAVPQETRVVAKFKVTKADGTTPPDASVRFACDPVARMFSSGRFSIQGTTIESHGADIQDISTIQLRTEGTRAGLDSGGGPAGLQSFDQRMDHKELRDTGGTLVGAEGDDNTKGSTQTYWNASRRSDKHAALQDNAADEIELSTPLGSFFTFCRQTRSFIPSCELDIRLVVSESATADALYTEAIPAAPRNRGLIPGGAAGLTLGSTAVATVEAANKQFVTLLPEVTATADAHLITLSDLYLDVMVAVPLAQVPRPASWQCAYRQCTLFTRTLSATGTHNIQFAGLPPSVNAIVLGVRDNAHTIGTNKELYLVGGSKSSAKYRTAQLSIGQLSLPTPAYQVEPEKLQVGRMHSDFLSFVGADHVDGAGGFSLREYAESVLLAFRICQEKDNYATTATVRLTFNTNLPADSELCMWVFHQRVVELTYGDEPAPIKVLADEVVG
jgi:hypothetical protein